MHQAHAACHFAAATDLPALTLVDAVNADHATGKPPDVEHFLSHFGCQEASHAAAEQWELD